MGVWSEVALSEIELTRIDAEFYRPEYLAAKSTAGERKLKDYGIAVLHPAEFTRRYSEVGHFVLLAQNNRDNRYEWSTKQRVAPFLLPIISRNRLEFGDVTITRSGANYGQTSVISIELENEPLYACADLLILRSKFVDGHLISTYLNSSVGRLLLDRGAYGAAQPHLAPSYIKEIPFPAVLLSVELEVKQLILDSRKLAMESSEEFAEAQQILESALGLDKLTFHKPVGYTAQFSHIETSHRSDAQHYQPRFKQLIDHISSYPSARIREIRTLNRRGLQPIYAGDGPVAVVNSQHLGPKHIDYDGLEKTSTSAFAAAHVAHIQQNDLLVYTTGAYIGRTNVYLSQTPAMASNHVNIIRLKPGVDGGYMALVFQSIIGQFQTQQHSRGSAQAELYPSDIDRFLVPLLDADKQKVIGDLVRESLVKQQESGRMLEQAKARVEQLIEEAVQS